jgi:hypothetical protein
MELEFALNWTVAGCGIADRRHVAFTVDEFNREFFGKAPVIFRNPHPNTPTLREVERPNLLRRYGDVPIRVAPSGYYGHGGYANTRTTLGALLGLVAQWPPQDVYFFDSKRSDFMEAAVKKVAAWPLAHYIPAPHVKEGEQWRNERMRFTVGGPASGIAFHAHTATYNELFVGAKRWSLFAPGTAPPEGYTMGHSHFRWLREVLPLLPAQSRPLECVQHVGDVLYLPDGWLHATLNLRQSVSVAVNGGFSLPGTGAYHQAEAMALMQDEQRTVKATAAELREAEEHMRTALSLDPTNAHFYQQLAMAVSKQGRYQQEAELLASGIALNRRSASLRNNLVSAYVDLHRQARQGESGTGPDYLSLAFNVIKDAVDARLVGGSGEANFGAKLDTIARELEQDELLGRIPSHRKISSQSVLITKGEWLAQGWL